MGGLCHCFTNIRSVMVRIESMVLLNEVVSRQGPLLSFLPIAWRLQDALPALYPWWIWQEHSSFFHVLSAKKNMFKIVLKNRMNQQKRKADQTLQYGQSMAVIWHGMTMTGYVPSGSPTCQKRSQPTSPLCQAKRLKSHMFPINLWLLDCVSEFYINIAGYRPVSPWFQVTTLVSENI